MSSLDLKLFLGCLMILRHGVAKNQRLYGQSLKSNVLRKVVWIKYGPCQTLKFLQFCEVVPSRVSAAVR